MKIQTKIKLILLLLIIFLIIGTANVFAASISVGPSKSSVSPGESFSVSITASGATGKVRVSVSNGSVSSSSLWLEPSGTVTVTAGSSGTVGINVSAVDMSDASGNEVSPSGSATVNIVVPEPPPSSGGNSGSSSSNSGSSSGNSSSSTTTTKPSTTTKPNTSTTKPEEVKKSSDATLKSLVIEGQELYPEFSATVNEYNVKVTNDITSVQIIPTVNDDKAKFVLDGVYENLEVGENTANVVVTAEDGSTMRYIIRINRARENLGLSTLKITYVDELGEVIDITPELEEETYEYSLNDLPYYISRLDFEVISNLKEAQIEILGNEELQEGENIITITITMPSESEEVEDEVLTYKFMVNKEVAPKVTLIGKIQNWFKGITGTIGEWIDNNLYLIVVGALVLCSITLVGLTVYLIIDYKKYRKLLEKVAQITRMNTENIVKNETNVITESAENIEIKEDIVEEETKQKGRHF